MQIDRLNPLPLYYQLKTHILLQIERGELRVGEMLPSERELQEAFTISRATVRQALNELVREGFLIRQHGVGTIVAQPKIAPELLQLTSFSEDMRSRGLHPSAITLEVTRRLPSPAASRALGVATTQPIWSIYRLRLANNEPVGLHLLSIPPWITVAQPELEMLSSYYELLEQKFSIQITHATETLSASNADQSQANLLGVVEGQALLSIERTTFDQINRPIEFVQFVYRGDRYQYQFTLHRTTP